MFDLSKRWPIELDRAPAMFLILGVLGLLAAIYQLDAPASLWTQSWPPLLREAFFAITDLGKSDWILIPALILYILLALAGLVLPAGIWKQAAREAALLAGFVFIGTGFPGLVANLIKRFIGRGRPEVFADYGALDFQNFFNDVAYQSFPSGHATTIFALCFVLSFLLPRLWPWMLAVAIAVGVSRVVVGVHYPTDVFAGILVGTFGAYAVRNFFAARGWLFEQRPDGKIVRKPLTALGSLLERRG